MFASPLLLLALTWVPPALVQEPTQVQSDALTARVSVIGASVSAGAGNSLELVTGRDVRFGAFLQCMLPQAGTRVFDHGDLWFFTEPIVRGKAQVDAALAEEPTLVVALDFLFWYGYGDGYVSDDDRLADLELGLAQLDRFACPIVIGDLPDITAALQGKGPLGMPVVTRGMIPREVALNRLNTRIAFWLAERPRVSLVPIGPMLTRMRGGLQLELRGNSWKPEALVEVLQPDLLHPTVRGTIWVALATVDVIARAHPAFAESALEFDEHKVRERLLAATADERAKEEQKRAKWAERRRRAEERDRAREGAGTGGGGG